MLQIIYEHNTVYEKTEYETKKKIEIDGTNECVYRQTKNHTKDCWSEKCCTYMNEKMFADEKRERNCRELGCKG